MQDTLAAALAWAGRGFPVFPLSPATNRPVVEDWPNVATTNADAIRHLWGDREFNIGVHCVDMIVVDVDVKKGKEGMASLAELDLPLDTLIVRTPSGGRHIYYRGPNVSNSVQTALGKGLDVRSGRGYVVAPGSVRDGIAYTLEQDMPVREAPEYLIERCGKPRERADAPIVEVDQGAATLRAVQWLTNDAQIAVEFDGGDDTTYRVVCQLRDWGLTEANALIAMTMHWNHRCLPPWEPADLQRKVANAYEYATGTQGGKTAEADMAGIDLPEITETAPSPWRWIDEGSDWRSSVKWLFYGLIPEVGVGVMTGPSGSGKTFVGYYLAEALATGKPFFGVTPDDFGGTAVLAAESPGSQARRMAALEAPERLPISALVLEHLGKKGALGGLLAPLKAKSDEMRAKFGAPLRLVILDTLSASGLLEDEQDNAKAAAAMKALGKLAEMLGLFILVMHHPTKDGKGERGAGAIRGGADVMFTITRDEYQPGRDIAVTKARDGEEGPLGTYSLPVTTLGEDDRGRPITSCTVTAGPPSARSSRTPPHVEQCAEACNVAIDKTGIEREGGKWAEATEAELMFFNLKPGSHDLPTMKRQFWAALRHVAGMGMISTKEFDGRAWVGRDEIMLPE